MNIHVPSIAPQNRITQWMWEDTLRDPVFGFKLFFGIDMDAFQGLRARTMWFVPEVYDSSGFGTAKSTVLWGILNLRAVLIPDQQLAIFYKDFGQMKRVFWPIYKRDFANRPLFRAQLGGTTERDDEEAQQTNRDASFYSANFRSGGKLIAPAPNWLADMESNAGVDLNVGALDEWTKSVSKGTDGLKQFRGRIRRGCYNQHHPLWGNHQIYTATAESMSHPAWRIYEGALKRVAAGDPRVACLSFSYKDYSHRKCHTGKSFRESFMDENAVRTQRANLSREEFRREVLGLWSRNGKGWYSDEAIARCVELGRLSGLVGLLDSNQGWRGN